MPDANAVGPDDVLILSDPLIWSDPRFHTRLLEGLRKEGFCRRSVDSTGRHPCCEQRGRP